jgi:hypothetical protein
MGTNRENMADLDVDAGRADYEGCAAARRETVFWTDGGNGGIWDRCSGSGILDSLSRFELSKLDFFCWVFLQCSFLDLALVCTVHTMHVIIRCHSYS